LFGYRKKFVIFDRKSEFRRCYRAEEESSEFRNFEVIRCVKARRR